MRGESVLRARGGDTVAGNLEAGQGDMAWQDRVRAERCVDKVELARQLRM